MPYGKGICYRVVFADGTKAPWRTLMLQAVVDLFRGGKGKIFHGTAAQRMVEDIADAGKLF